MFLNSVSQMKFGVLESEFAELGFQAVLESEAVVKNFMAEGVIDGIVNIVVGFFKMIASAIEAVIRFILNLFGVKTRKDKLEDDLKKAKASFEKKFSGSSDFEDIFKKWDEEIKRDQEERARRKADSERRWKESEAERKAKNDKFYKDFNDYWERQRQRAGGSGSSGGQRSSSGSNSSRHADQVLNNPGGMTIRELCNMSSTNPAYNAGISLMAKFDKVDFMQSLSSAASDSLISGVTKIQSIAEGSPSHTSFLLNLNQAYQKFLQPLINEKQTVVDSAKVSPSTITVQGVYDLAAKEEKVAGTELKDIAKKYAGIVAAIGKSFTSRVESAGLDTDAQKAAQAEFVSVKTAISVGYTVLTQSARNVARMVTFSKEIRESCVKIITLCQEYYKRAKAEGVFDEEDFNEDEYLAEIDPELEDDGMFAF